MTRAVRETTTHLNRRIVGETDVDGGLVVEVAKSVRVLRTEEEVDRFRTSLKERNRGERERESVT